MTVKVKIEGVDGGLNSQTSKADEIGIVHALWEKFHGTQTYLESLFTKDFVTWVDGSIRDDVSTDMMDHLMACEKEIGDARAQISRMMDESQKQFKASTEACRALQSDKENVEAHWKGLYHAAEKQTHELNEAIVLARRKQHDLTMRLAEMDEAMKGRDREILELKARLYDLTQGQKGGKEDGTQG